MKKAKLEITMNVPDDFTPGKCGICPLAKREGREDVSRAYYEIICCKLGYPRELCPVEENNGRN